MMMLIMFYAPVDHLYTFFKEMAKYFVPITIWIY